MTARKPEFEIPYKLAQNPSKNYLFHLLYYHVSALSPARSLDAGIGDLRNLWMFPGRYVGIGHQRHYYLKGLRRPPNPDIIRERGRPDVYLMRLESDFSFLGEFDLCVSTNTLVYVEDQWDVIARLVDRVKRGGALIIDVHLDTIDIDRLVEFLVGNFEFVDVTYVGKPECNFDVDPTQLDEIERLTRVEMTAPNVKEGHAQAYVFATEKEKPAGPVNPAPEMIAEDGLFTVVSDIPYLDN